MSSNPSRGACLGFSWRRLCIPLVILGIAFLGFGSGYWLGISKRLHTDSSEKSRLEEFIYTADRLG